MRWARAAAWWSISSSQIGLPSACARSRAFCACASATATACRRALSFDQPTYRSVKTILSKGLDQMALIEHAFDELASVYTGAGRFHRDTRELLVH